MNKKLISPFIVGFAAGVLQIVPLLKGFACCLVIPAAAYFSLLLDRKANKSNDYITFKKSAGFGILTGLFAAIFATTFEIIITLITKNNDIVYALPELNKMFSGMPIDPKIKQELVNIMSNIAKEIKTYGFSFFYTISIFFNNLFINIIFGFIGGAISMQILNKKKNYDL